MLADNLQDSISLKFIKNIHLNESQNTMNLMEQFTQQDYAWERIEFAKSVINLEIKPPLVQKQDKKGKV